MGHSWGAGSYIEPVIRHNVLFRGLRPAYRYGICFVDGWKMNTSSNSIDRTKNAYVMSECTRINGGICNIFLDDLLQNQCIWDIFLDDLLQNQCTWDIFLDDLLLSPFTWELFLSFTWELFHCFIHSHEGYMFGKHKSQQEWKMRLKVRLGEHSEGRTNHICRGRLLPKAPPYVSRQRCRLKARQGEGILKMTGLGWGPGNWVWHHILRRSPNHGLYTKHKSIQRISYSIWWMGALYPWIFILEKRAWCHALLVSSSPLILGMPLPWEFNFN